MPSLEVDPVALWPDAGPAGSPNGRGAAARGKAGRWRRRGRRSTLPCMFLLSLPIVVAGVAVATLVLARRVLRRWPRHRRCPGCAAPTRALRAEGLLRHLPWLFRERWCCACGWTGWVNGGPRDAPGGPLGHASGFRWRADGEGGTGFRWAGHAPARRAVFAWRDGRRDARRLPTRPLHGRRPRTT